MQKVSLDNSRLIRVSIRTYEELANQGTLKDSFDSVIRKLIQNQQIQKEQNDK
jgi:hypothetical protein